MKVYVLRYYYARHGEDFTRSVHMTYKGVLLEKANYLVEALMDVDWEEDSEREMKIINKIIEKDDPITTDELIQHIDTLEWYAENIELYAEIETFTLEP